MADVSRFSDVVTNDNATPKVINPSTKVRGHVNQSAAMTTYVSGDSAPSLNRILRVPSSARVSKLEISHLAFTTAGAVDVGLHYIPGETPLGTTDGAAVDADFFASAKALTAAEDNVDITNESTTYTPAKQMQPIWQAVGLTADPRCDFHLTSTVATTINSTPLDVVYKINLIQ